MQLSKHMAAASPPPRRFCEPDRTGMVFGYGVADLPQIAQGLRKLRGAFRGDIGR